MGLDNYWMKSKEELGNIEGEFQICGGMFSGSGNNSFRGKVYHSFVEDITGVSLYGDRETNEIPIETVKQINPEIEVAGIGIGAPNGNYYSGTIENAANLPFVGVVHFTDLIQKNFPEMEIQVLMLC